MVKIAIKFNIPAFICFVYLKMAFDWVRLQYYKKNALYQRADFGNPGLIQKCYKS